MSEHAGQHRRLLHHRPPGRQITEEHSQPSRGVMRVVEWTDHLRVCNMRIRILLSQSDAGHSGSVAVDKATFGQTFQHGHDAPSPVQVLHVGGTGRCQTDQVRRAGGDLIDTLERQIDSGLVGNGLDVKHGVCGTTEGGVKCQRISKRSGG